MFAPFLIALIVADTAASASAPSPQIAVIAQTAATNMASFTIVVPRTGAATVRTGIANRSVHVTPALATQLYADLDRAGALGALPAGHCMKSASFGTTTTIEYGGERSPDLQCTIDSMERALNADVRAISRMAVSGGSSGDGHGPIITAPTAPK